jgi:hypothetical protein
VSTYYARTWLGVRTRGQLPPAHDVQLSPAWERKLSQKLTLHIEAGAALAVQPQLCQKLDPLLIAGNRCSIDARAPGIRGYDGAAPLEAELGRLGTLAPAGEVSLSYTAPRRHFELRLFRGYEPEPYAGALSLVERLSGNLHWRPLWDLLLFGSAQLLHSAQTSPARVSPPSGDYVYTPLAPLPPVTLPVENDGLLRQPIAPQNRTLLMTMGLVGAEYHVLGPLAVFLETSFIALKIRGERVPQVPSATPSPMPTAEVSLFPSTPGSTYQDTYRVSLIFGVRGQWDTVSSPRREPDLFTQTRAVP